MSKKNTPPVKEKEYIAFNSYTETIIGKGSRKEITACIETYAEEEGYDEDGVEENIHVFELGQEMTVRAFPRGLEISIES